MIYVIHEDAGHDGAAKKRNSELDGLIDNELKNFPTLFGDRVTNAAEVKNCLKTNRANNTTFHIFAHGNQKLVGKYENDDSDSFKVSDPIALLLRDELKVFDQEGVNRLILHSCYGGSHVASLAAIIKAQVLPKFRELTIEGANGAAFTDGAGNLRVAKSDKDAMAFNEQIAKKPSADRYNVLINQYCDAAGKSLQKIQITGEYVKK